MIPKHLILNIDLDAVAQNFLFLKNRAPLCAPVLKADAYHLGADIIGQTLWDHGARVFYVAYLEEALELQKTLPLARILVFNGPYGSWDWPRFFKHHDLIPVINTLEDFYQWQFFLKQTKSVLDSCLHVDTGMNRLGLPWNDYESIWQDCHFFRYMMSHLSSSEDFTNHRNLYQKQKTDILKQRHPKAILSLANSSGIFLGYTYDMIRPGMALYGVNPVPYTQNPLKSALSAKARILQVQTLSPGESVGYNETFVAPCPMRIATLSCGYADGIPLSLNQGGYVIIHGKKAQILGKISMDLMTVDTTSIPETRIGEWAILFNENATLDIWAQITQMTVHAMITGLLQGNRFKKSYIRNSLCVHSSQQSVG